MPFPIAALFLVVFDQKVGYSISWHRSSSPDLKLDGVEYKSLPSGLHAVEKDVVRFIHQDLEGLAAFRRGEGDATRERGARFVAVGALGEQSEREDVGAVAGRLEVIAEALVGDAREDMSALEDLWKECSIRETPVLKSRKRTADAMNAIPPTLPPHHPAQGMLRLLALFGPLLFPLHRAAFLRKRILLLGAAPVQRNCEMVYALAALSHIPREIIEDVLLDTADAQAKEQIDRLYSVGIHDIPSLAEQKMPQGWVACTTDDIFADKTTLWDMLVTLPSHTGSRWPSIRTSEGRTVKATQRDLKRYRLLRDELTRTREPAYRDDDEDDADGDRRPLIKRQSSYVRETVASEGEEEVAEPVTWSAMAYDGFMWWASAGEQAAWEDEEDTADRILLNDFPDLLSRDNEIGKAADPLHTRQTAVLLVAYFARLTSLVLRTLGDVVADADDETEEGIEEDAILVLDAEARTMGLNSWHEGDRDFITEAVRMWFGREAQVQWSEIRVCGVRVC